MPTDGTTIELPLTRGGDTGPSHVRLRRFRINWEPHRALALGIAQGNIPALGESFIFDTGTLYCGGHAVEAVDDTPDYTDITALFVRQGELRYVKIPSEVGFRSVSVTVGSSEVGVPLINKYPIAGTPAFEYVTDTVAFKRRDTVALVTVNVLSEAFNAALYGQLIDILNFTVSSGPGVGEGPWLFESFTSNELSDKVTQLVGSFRSTAALPAQPVPTALPGEPPIENPPFDIPIPALPPFASYHVRPGPPEDYGPGIGEIATDPIIVVHEPYPELAVYPEVLNLFLPIFPVVAP